MIKKDVIIVGGGPAGSACAWQLSKAGLDCLILDQQIFPRFKPCAGWITPLLLNDLQLEIKDYPYGFTTFRSFEIAINNFEFKISTLQYAIRRFEFDKFLLDRSNTLVQNHAVKSIQETPAGFEIDGEFSSTFLVGAGGTNCPVNRHFFQPDNPRNKESLIVAQEEEFLYPYSDSRCHLWFLQNNLPGYAWYVPKAEGYVNVGVGGKAETLKANGDSLKNHWNLLVEKLDKEGLIRNHSYHPSGHSYYLNHGRSSGRKGNVLIIGDSIGLATKDMGEGIHPAVKSGLLAAKSIIQNEPYSLSKIPRYSFFSLLRLR
jgi:flavin-dependent dehydrogenase